MMHTHRHAHVALSGQKKPGTFAFRSAFMRCAFSSYVYSWGLGNGFSSGIQRTEYSTGSWINTCSSLILIPKVGGIPFFGKDTTWQGLGGAIHLSTPSPCSLPSSYLAPFDTFKTLGKMARERKKRETGKHTSECPFCGFFFPMLEIVEERKC